MSANTSTSVGFTAASNTVFATELSPMQPPSTVRPKKSIKAENLKKSNPEQLDALISFACDILRNSDITFDKFKKDTSFTSEATLEQSQGENSDFIGDTKELLEFMKKFARAYATFKKIGALKLIDAFIPEVNKDYTIAQFPFVIPLPITEMSRKVDMQELMKFMSDSYIALAPIIESKVTAQFNRRFPEINSSLINSIFISEAGFTYRLIEVDQINGMVKLLEVMWDDLNSKFKDTEFTEELNMATFRKDFILHANE